MRQSRIAVEPRPKLAVGDKIALASTKRRWTVRGVTVGGRFAILTQPFNLQRTVLYTILDFDWGIRGKDDHYGMGYESEEDIAAALHSFQHTESEDPPDVTNACEYRGDWCIGGADVSHRSGNHVRIDLTAINDEPWTAERNEV